MPEPPDLDLHPPFNLSEHLLGDRVREGRGDRTAILTDVGTFTYGEIDALANRYGNLLLRSGVRPEERVLIALADGPAFVAALFGTLRIGAVAVMLNPHLKPDEIEHVLAYTRGAALFVEGDRAPFFREVVERVSARRTEAGGSDGGGAAGSDAAEADAGPAWGPGVRAPRDTFVVGGAALEERLAAMPEELEPFPTHPDDVAIWLFSGGTTGRPKGVLQTHASFANTTELYGKGVLGLTERDVTLSVPKLYFGYATGSNLFFPFAAGGATVLFPERCTPEVLFDKIERFRPTLLVNVPTMISQMMALPDAAERDLSSLRVATSAGEALPVELHRRWKDAYGVELLDGLGTAEMWHIFLTNRPGDVHPGTLGKEVPGFDVRVRDRDGKDLPDGEIGWLWVRGASRAQGYWQRAAASARAFRGEWYVSGDMVVRDETGIFTYCGRGDDMLKVKGKWLSPREIENCLLRHPEVREAVVVGVPGPEGLIEPVAWVIPGGSSEAPTAQDEAPEAFRARALREHVAAELASYKTPSRIHVVEDLPRTHLGKVDRAALRALDSATGDERSS